MEGLLAIHKAGVEHRSFEDYNIVVAETWKGEGAGKEYFPVIVDFGKAEEHVCEFEGTLDTHSPRLQLSGYPSYSGCGELYEVCKEYADLYYPSMLSPFRLADHQYNLLRQCIARVNVYGHSIPVDLGTSEEEVLESMKAWFEDDVNEEEVLRAVRGEMAEYNRWRDIRNKYDSMPLNWHE